ncbi:MAG: hypothetical protein KDC87_12525, partial [Planctomycetes bacterium]|nr:hypothetical protein [Planctomycetota bacterium]
YPTTGGAEFVELRGHDSWIGCLRFSRDGKQLLSAGHKQLLVFDVARRMVVRSFTATEHAPETHGCRGGIDAVDWTADGRRIVAVSRDQQARVWDGASGKLLWSMELPASRTRVEFSPDGAVLGLCGNGGASLRDAANGALRVALTGHRGRVTAIRFAPDGRRVATLGEDGWLRFWRTHDGTRLGGVRGHEGSGRAAYFSPDGRRLATCGEDGRLVLWDVATRSEVWSRDVDNGYCLAWSRDGDRLWVLPLDKQVWCFDAVSVRRRPR